MQVETFEATEITTDGVECEKEALDLIKELGLTGQQELVSGEGQLAARNPYRKMTKVEYFVYSALCPQKTELKDYSDGPIPTRILRMARSAKDSFRELQVWHPSNADIKDPVLVGVNGDRYSTREFFILGRWGEVLLPMSEMMPLAAKMFRDKMLVKLKGIQRDIEKDIERLGECADDVLADAKTDPSFHGIFREY